MMITDFIKKHKTGIMTAKTIFGRVLVTIICVIVCFFMLFPFYYMFTSSIKTAEEYMSPIPTFIPRDLSIFGYKTIFKAIDIFGRFFSNSMYVSVIIPLLQTVICLPAAYALARLNFFGKNAIFMMFVVAMMLPGQLTIIQNYRTIVKLNLVNNLNSVVLISMFSPSCIFMMRQFFLSLPKELEEAGKIDGCGVFRNFLYIMAPLSVSTIAVNLILCFNGVWGDFFAPMIFLKRMDSMTLPIGLTVIMGALKSQNPTVLMAALTITCVPVLIVFFVFRKKLIAGIATTGLKI